MDCTTTTKLIEALIHVWLHDQEIKKNCKTLVLSMKIRVKSVLENKGGHINYLLFQKQLVLSLFLK